MRDWNPATVAAAAGATLIRDAEPSPGPAGPIRTVIDSRSIEPGDLFIALAGERTDGGRYAAAALKAGAWGVVVAPEWVADASAANSGVIIGADRPLRALGALARAWRRELDATVVAVTGSVAKTSTKELIAALIARERTVAASRANFNTEIGLPLELLAAAPGTEVLVLELAMRGFGQIADLTEICEPDIGLITNLAPVHLEQVGSLLGVARAKGELPVGLRDGAAIVVPSGEERLAPYLRPELDVITYGPGGDIAPDTDGRSVGGGVALARAAAGATESEPPFPAHHLLNACAAVAVARAAGVQVKGAIEIRPPALRGERIELPRGATVIDDCYNANPTSMRIAIEELKSISGRGRRVAVLGDMRELGVDAQRYHEEIGAVAAANGVDLLITVGSLAATMAPPFLNAGTAVGDREVRPVADAAEAAALADELVARGDTVLVKGSRGIGLEVVAPALGGVRRGAA